ncbi:MAG: ATP-binding protein [Actinobacteria bacterium]|nr:ATP-binding protein [Actinomycetota bacterium]
MLAATISTCVIVIFTSIAALVVIRHEVYLPVNSRLNYTANLLVHFAQRGRYPFLKKIEGPFSPISQLITPAGTILTDNSVPIPVTKGIQAVLNGTENSYSANTTYQGSPIRLLALPVPNGGAVVVGTPITAVLNQMHNLQHLIIFIALSGIVLAGLLGWLVARAALQPLRKLATTVERVSQTMDLSQRVDVTTKDELGGLASNFNQLLQALEQSTTRQRQLVQDAAHELRTPLTSLRTNTELINRLGEMDIKEQQQLSSDVLAQLEELSVLVNDLVVLAREEEPSHPSKDFRLDALVSDALERAQSHARIKECTFSYTSQPCWIHGIPERLMRAISNVLDNAIKWSHRGGTIQVCCQNGNVSVRDYGAGITEEDLPHVFDRFYRATSARELPGSGLGLAIVKQIVEENKGKVSIYSPPLVEEKNGGGNEQGTLVIIELVTTKATKD